MKKSFLRKVGKIVLILAVLIVLLYAFWPRLINFMLPTDSRPGKIFFKSYAATQEEFNLYATELLSDFGKTFRHVDHFRRANIKEYKGPQTCLTCHEDIIVQDGRTGQTKTVNLMDNLLTSAHYRFFTTSHPNVYGFNGKLADNFSMGKINRPCPKPGSFAMTAWAELVVTEHGDTLSEGCGQCHIGGQHQAPVGEMMPGYRTTTVEKEAIDCLICHAEAYDMNYKQVIPDANGRLHWGQDRTIKAAMSVGTPTSQTCLRCHQHNLGGDFYVDETDPSFMQSMIELGIERPRIKHPGSKRGTPFSPEWDVHAAAGVSCIDCHVTEGHWIAKGKHTTTMMANDLPNTAVACTNCHGSEPHAENAELADYLNTHVEKVACTTCHIPSLHPDNATRRDFATATFEAGEEIYVYTDIAKETEPGKGIRYAWWNGDATFLGNPIGDNPNGENRYRFYQPTDIWPEFKDFDYVKWYENIMRPIAQKKPSKLYAMKVFNGKQHIDLQNIGPFGGMYVPYNLPVYYTTGNPDWSAQAEAKKSMMKKMYGVMFKYYMMDKFMSFMDVDHWNTAAYADVITGKKVEPRWIPNDVLLEISHAVRKDGVLTCVNCHRENSVLDWKALGYSVDDVKALSTNPLE